MEECAELLSLFGRKDKPDHETAYTMYQKAVNYNTTVNLYDTVNANENFFVGKQWEGINHNGLPTPQMNILKRVCLFTVASITSENVKVNATALANIISDNKVKQMVNIVNDEFEAIFERNSVPSLIREYARNAAVDGDGCLYTYWDAEAETGQKSKGQIRTEIVDNTRVLFGNPSDRLVQSQPWIIIEKREPARTVRRRAKENGFADWYKIAAEPDNNNAVDEAKFNDELATVLTMFWKDDDTGHIWFFEFTRECDVKEPTDMDITLYPITWLNWDYIKDCYHGQAMITGLIPNQIFINKCWAMSMVSIMNLAFPTRVFDQTRVPKITNQVGAAIGIKGGDVKSAVANLEGATINPQVAQYIQLAIEETEQSLGATSVALGDTRPDNTSAIIALQKAASTPSELTKQNLYSSIEDLARIYLEFMPYYGKRFVGIEPSEQQKQAIMFAQTAHPEIEMPDEVPFEFDFKEIKKHPMMIKIDVGASTYYSEIAAMQTMDNLLMNGHMLASEYTERLPDDYIKERHDLIKNMKSREAKMGLSNEGPAMENQGMMMQPPPSMPMGGDQVPNQPDSSPEVKGGGGYGALQRKINQEGTTRGIV